MAIKEADFARIKSGVVNMVSCGDWGVVIFNPDPNERFINLPSVILTLHTLVPEAVDIPMLCYVTTNGFEWEIFKGHGGAAHIYTLHWIATDAGT